MSLPLSGRKILVTREQTKALSFAEKIKALGGKPVSAPLLRIACRDRENHFEFFQSISKFAWIFFTSSNGVDCFFKLVNRYQVDIHLQQVKIAVVGRKTEEKLKQFGYAAQFIPSAYNADTMATEFLEKYSDPGPILLIQGNRSRDILPKRLEAENLLFTPFVVYETYSNEVMKDKLSSILEEHSFDYLTFTSPSTIEAFVEMTSHIPHIPCVCIGTTTELRAKQVGFQSILVPNEFTIDGMITCMINDIQKRG
ncbi:uroporphyrinogen-III synthase [Virgibacillus sp. AGTR]|uniref:Uroporphyrinogen-III synthase n=1 Tax=Virgibacillus salarius TaxID=447199 RepID=A0A941IC14_9BACI|nr:MULTISPECIES: uroporphyrinogen-III synthase [Virgibacillus]NAZ09647.1 uroporphyrinogen-III synthase [Agaribacter marinus]MBR7796937.1 uroporphyrinogen-III synthase [Virgibacillus salarius]MCC2252191.1 uroporphyrinogen-III synthase [Virgibacillus sp. AGTR]MDY7046389.1 uroporphyrinogen-III synthase [Virgibacillus sp. M23]QRZ17602.1 uroporphyrinogen-III synthase [Virgibacillus sp. AGTR]